MGFMFTRSRARNLSFNNGRFQISKEIPSRLETEGGIMRPLFEKESLNKIANVQAVRCRARREIRTHAGNVRRSAMGTIISEIDNLGRHLLQVHWGNGICTYVFPDEVEIVSPITSVGNCFPHDTDGISYGATKIEP